MYVQPFDVGSGLSGDDLELLLTAKADTILNKQGDSNE